MAATPLRDRVRQIIARFSAANKKAPERLAPPIEVTILDEIAGRLDDMNMKIDTINSQIGGVSDQIGGVSDQIGGMSDKLGDMTDIMRNLQNRADEQVPAGLQNQKEMTVTDALSYYAPPSPLFSADLKNQGPDTLHYCLNDPTLIFVDLKKGEGRTVSYGRGLISKIYFKCDSGETADIRITGTF